MEQIWWSVHFWAQRLTVSWVVAIVLSALATPPTDGAHAHLLPSGIKSIIGVQDVITPTLWLEAGAHHHLVAVGPAPTPRPASVGPVIARLLQQAVPSSQAWRDSLSDHQFKAAQPLPRGSVIHNGNSVLYHSSTQASGMDHRDRLEGRLPSHLGPSQHQEILSVRDIGERPINSECLHLGYQWHQKFTKPLAPVVQLLRTRGIRVHAYLDDWIIRADSPELCSAHAQETIHLLQSLGWTINWKKSLLEPSRIPEFPGLHFNLKQALISPPKSFLETLTSILSCLSTSRIMSARKITAESRTLLLSFTNDNFSSFFQLWIKQRWSQHAQPWDSPIQLNQEYDSHLHWFCRPEVLQGVPLHTPEPNLFLLHGCFSDKLGSQLARTTDYGTVVTARATMTHKRLELEVVRLAIWHRGPHWFQQTVRVYCDNSRAVAYIRKQGEMHSLSLFHKILELFQLLDKFTIILVPTHLPGARNLPAVAYYRNTPLSELCGLISWKSSSVFIHHYLCDMAADTDFQELSVVAAGTALLWRVVLHRLYTKAHHLLQ